MVVLILPVLNKKYSGFLSSSNILKYKCALWFLRHVIFAIFAKVCSLVLFFGFPSAISSR